MIRNSLLAAVFLLVLAGVSVCLGLAPDGSLRLAAPTRFIADSFPSAPALPESLPTQATEPRPLPLLVLWLPAIIAVLLFVWRRSMGQRVLPSMLPALVVLIHPATSTALRTVAGLGDLAALGLLAFGAVLLTASSSTWIGAGLVLLFLSVLCAPSGAVLSALAALALLERKPTMAKGALLLLLYGLARAHGMLLLDAWIDLPAGYHGVSGVPLFDFLDGVVAAAAAIVPRAAPLLIPAGGALSGMTVQIGLAVLVLLAVGMTLLPPERRFGGRYSPALGLVAVGWIAAQATWTGPLPSVAAVILTILVAQWIGAMGDDVDRTRVRSGASFVLGVALLGALGVSYWKTLPAYRSHAAFLESVGAALDAAPEHPVRIAAERAAVKSAAEAELGAMIRARLASTQADGGVSAGQTAARDRDLAVAAAIQGLLAPAGELLERAMAAAPAEDRDEMALDLADVYLRQFRAGDAVTLTEQIRARTQDKAIRAEAFAREAIGYATRGLRLPADAPADARDREMAQAWSKLDQAIETDPRCARALLDRGRLRLAHDQGTAALIDLEACARLRPDLAEPCLELAKLYFVRDLPEEGELWLKKAQQIAGLSDPDVRLLTARLMLFRGDPVGAMAMAESLQPEAARLRGGAQDLGELYRVLGRLAEEQKNVELIEPMCRLALFHGADRTGESVERLYRFLKEELRWEDVLQLLQDAETRGIPVDEPERKLALATKNSGYARLQAGDRRGALQLWMRTLSLSPDCSDLGAIPGLIRSLADDLPGSDLARLGDLGRAAFDRAREFEADGRLQDAARCFRTSGQLVPSMPYSHFGLAQVLEELGNRDEAAEAWKACRRAAKALLEEYRSEGDSRRATQMEQLLTVVASNIGAEEETSGD